MATPEQLLPTIILVASLLVILAVLIFLWSLRQFRLSRTDSYWRRRRTAGQRGLKALVWSIVLILLGGTLWATIVVAYFLYFRPPPTVSATKVAIASPTPPTSSPTPTKLPPTETTSPKTLLPTWTMTATLTGPLSPTSPTPTQTPTTRQIQTTKPPTPSATVQSSSTASTTVLPDSSPTSTPTPSMTPSPQFSLTPSLTLTATSTFTATPTQSPTLRPVNIASLTLESSVTPSANATLTITALDTQISSSYQPVNPAETFIAGFTRLYFFVTFSGMQPGILWRRELVLDDKVIQTHSYLWGLQEEGSAYFFFGQEDGFKAGQYHIRLYLGKLAEPIAEKTFVVKEAT